jgi:hypothetical protein
MWLRFYTVELKHRVAYVGQRTPWLIRLRGGGPWSHGVDPDPSEQTCHNFKPRNYHKNYAHSTRMVSDLLIRGFEPYFY